MDDAEIKISGYIDDLNAEKRPEYEAESPEMQELLHTVRLVRTLREPAMPGKDFPGNLAAAAGRFASKRAAASGKRWFAGFAAAAAALLLIFFSLPLGGGYVVYAMQRAYGELKAYHGVLTVSEKNGQGEVSTQATLDVWADREGRYYIEELEGAQKGLITANNGQIKWQADPAANEVSTFPAFPDSYRFILELGEEVDNAGNALDVQTIGEEMISGRNCTVLKVTPKGGEPYRIWIDKESRLPLQKQSGITGTVPYQYTAVYTDIDFLEAIPAEKTVYTVPDGFSGIDRAQEQWMNTLSEACSAVGFEPREPGGIPDGYERYGIAVQNGDTVKIYYRAEAGKKAVLTQKRAGEDMKPDVNAILGKVGESTAEILLPVQDSQGILGGVDPYAGSSGVNSIRWHADGMEYIAAGNIPVDKLSGFAAAMSGQTVVLPDQLQNPAVQVDIAVDMEAEEYEHKSVDAGHWPWKLDPAFTAQVFVCMQISPEGITGDYPVAYEDMTVVQNTGSEAVVEVKGDETPIRRVYLKRLVRQDATGVWTVVGYDPV